MNTDLRVTLKSPYGKLRTPGGGVIENGRDGTLLSSVFTALEAARILFDGETQPVRVPLHWFEVTSLPEAEATE